MTTQSGKKYAGLLLLALVLISSGAFSQLTQTVRGKVVDQVLQQPLRGATVTIPAISKSALTAEDGSFRIAGVPVGNQQVTVSFIGYKNSFLDNIVVNSGKEVVLTISLEADADIQQQVEVVARSRKNKTINEMSLVSARAFTVEETQKYAAAVNDPLRMATSFAGVVTADDGNNEIIIRGNAPAGLLWRMEGVDIPNPNHFSMAGSSGGGISILSAQLLANSDFVTGAFSAEYGNALSGVFDLRLRKGNNENREFTAQAGVLGLNLAAEGPLMPFYNGSYLINYRYSTLQLLSKMGLDLGAGGATNFQDLSFNIYLPTARKGDFTIFGFGGLSDQKMEIEKDTLKWESESDRYGGVFRANTTAVGATHTIMLGDRTQLKSSVAWSYTKNEEDELYAQTANDRLNTMRNNYQTRKWILSSVVNHKFSARDHLRAGVIGNIMHYNFYLRARENPGDPVLERINTTDGTSTIQAYAQWHHKTRGKFSYQGGLHYLHLLLNNTASLEPRASVKFDADRKNSISFGYGLHSQIQPLGVYFAKTDHPENGNVYTNKNLKFTKAHHFVLSYGHAFNNRLRFKAEAYYQHLFNVPVSIYDSITFSTLNIRGEYISDELVNKGKGRNYGVDLSLEKNLGNNFYFLLNNSLYRSRYTAADGIERDTRFNGGYVTNFTGGKEIVLKEGKKTIGINVKLIYAGGFRNTPIDLDLSTARGYAVYVEKEAFTLQNPAYFRTDVRLSMKWNKRNLTSTLSLDMQNLTNRQNVYGTFYDPYKKKLIKAYQAGLIPVLNYKVEF